MAWAASKGVTAVADLDVPWYEVAALRRARASGKLRTRVSVHVPLSDWRLMVDTGRTHGIGDQWLRVAGVKGYVDGSLGSKTALFYQPYNDSPGTYGLLTTPEDSLRAWIGGADSAGLQIAVHAIGERANGLVLDIYDSVAQAHGPRDRRFRVEHAQHLRRSDIPRLPASACWLRCSRSTSVTMAAGPRRGSVPSGSRPCMLSALCRIAALISVSARTGMSHRSIRYSGFTPQSLAEPWTESTRKAGYPRKRSRSKRPCEPTPRAMRTEFLQNAPAAGWPRGYLADYTAGKDR